VIPTDMEPLASFADICGNEANFPIVEALKKLAAKGILTYVPGNHDMPFSTSDLAMTKQFIEDEFPGIKYICDPYVPTGVYRSGKLVAEHGSHYCLFNAPDTWTNTPSFLPIGYFISRLVAYKISKTGTDQNVRVILENFFEQFFHLPIFVKAMFNAIASDANLQADDLIKMTENLSFPHTVGDIGTFYENLTENWEQNRQDIDWKQAAEYDGVGDLSQAAIDTYFPRFDLGQNIVIFGHTHKAVLRAYPENDPSGPDAYINPDFPRGAIYANCGTWVDWVPSTYVETEEDANKGRHYVRLWAYPEKKLLQEDFVEL
jgi:UDP-2,3-diacylglucosamine pyrophosphatase LpxH